MVNIANIWTYANIKYNALLNLWWTHLLKIILFIFIYFYNVRFCNFRLHIHLLINDMNIALMIGGNIKHDKIKELCFIAQRRRICKRLFSFDGYGLLSPLLSFIPLIDDIARRRLTIGTFYWLTVTTLL